MSHEFLSALRAPDERARRPKGSALSRLGNVGGLSSCQTSSNVAERRRCSPVAGLAALFLAALGSSACKLDVHAGNEMDAIGPTTWDVDSQPKAIDRSYFVAEKDSVLFVVEWTCTSCADDHQIDFKEGFERARPILREAVLRHEPQRIEVSKLGTGALGVKQLVSIMKYQLHGETRTYRVAGDRLDELWDWRWTLGGKEYHVHGAGFYFDQVRRQLYYTTYWDAPADCPGFSDLTVDSAADLAMPVMKQVLTLRLHERVPRLGDRQSSPAEMFSAPVGLIGVGIACPDPACQGQPNCSPRIFRASRTLDQIRGAS